MAALWPGSLNLACGTAATRGTIAAVVSTAVMVWAVGLVIVEWRSRRRRRARER